MSFDPVISVSQSISNKRVITILDVSTGSDGSIAFKRIYLQTAYGTYLVPSGTTTDYAQTADANIDLDVLDRDYALNIYVAWCNSGGTELYNAGSLYLFKDYAESYMAGLTQAQTGNPVLLKDGDYLRRKFELRELVDSAEQAVTGSADIFTAQLCIDQAATYLNNTIYFF